MILRISFNPSFVSQLFFSILYIYLYELPCAGFVGLFITTECGRLKVSPGEVAIIPQGFRFNVDLPDGPSRGYVAEIFGTHFQLPDLGPIGIFSPLQLRNLSYHICYLLMHSMYN